MSKKGSKSPFYFVPTYRIYNRQNSENSNFPKILRLNRFLNWQMDFPIKSNLQKQKICSPTPNRFLDWQMEISNKEQLQN